jgi:glutaminyl-tRNA synthetase
VIARQYSNLFNVQDPNELDWKSPAFTEALNPNSEVVWKDALIEEAFTELKDEYAKKDVVAGGDNLLRFQAVRTAYFAVDFELDSGKVVLNEIVSLKEDKGK